MSALDHITSLKDIDAEITSCILGTKKEENKWVHLFDKNPILQHSWSIRLGQSGEGLSNPRTEIRFEATSPSSSQDSKLVRFRKRDRYFLQKSLVHGFMDNTSTDSSKSKFFITGHGVQIERRPATVRENDVLFPGARKGDIVASFHVHITDESQVAQDLHILHRCIEALSLRTKFPRTVVFVHADASSPQDTRSKTSQVSSATHLTELWKRIDVQGPGVAAFVVLTSCMITRGMIRMAAMFSGGSGCLQLQCMSDYKTVVDE